MFSTLSRTRRSAGTAQRSDAWHSFNHTFRSTEGRQSVNANAGLAGLVEIISLNYQDKYGAYSDARARRCFGSETASWVTTRGTYMFPVPSSVKIAANIVDGANNSKKCVTACKVKN